MRSIRVKGGVPVFFPMTLELLEVREKCHFPYSSKTMGYINRKRRLFRCKVSNNKAEVLLTCDCQQITMKAEQQILVSGLASRWAQHRGLALQVFSEQCSALEGRRLVSSGPAQEVELITDNLDLCWLSDRFTRLSYKHQLWQNNY